MDRLAEKLALWHNRHPLAKRVSAFDVHTVGVVALPFMHDRPPAAPAEPIEPVLTDEVVLEEAQFDDQDEHQGDERSLGARARDAMGQLWAGLRALAGMLRPKDGGQGPDRGSALFSERIINRLRTRRVVGFARRHGYQSPPGQPDWPQRVVAIDERLMARHATRAGGAWPYELYLISAGIDAGASRTRVLLAEGPAGQLFVLGRRILDPRRLLMAALLPLVGAAALWWWLSGSPEAADAEIAAAVAGAASAASAPAAAAASAPASAAAAEAPPAAASASPYGVPASQLGASTGSAEDLELPNLRPQIVTLRRPRAEPAPALGAGVAALEARRAAEAASAAASSAAVSSAPKTAAAPGKTASAAADAGTEPSKPKTAAQDRPEAEPARSAAPPAAATAGPPVAMPSGKQVALVGQPSANRADAEATLERMLASASLLVPDRSRLQSQVFKTHEGWRPAIWPFASREEAQLINATMIARGLHTRAVDF